jgi:hypothetical protein
MLCLDLKFFLKLKLTREGSAKAYECACNFICKGPEPNTAVFGAFLLLMCGV